MLKEEINQATQALKEGKVLLYPTDTVWGLGCDVNHEEAIQRILTLKQSPANKSMIILVADTELLYQYVHKIPDLAWELIEYAEKPLTIIYPQGKNVAPGLLAEDGSLAIRVVKDSFCRDFLRKAGRGIVSTSANLSGQKAPDVFDAIDTRIIEGADYVVGYGRQTKAQHLPSTIIKIGYEGEFKFIRK